MSVNAIDRAIEEAGGVKNLAKKLGEKPGTVSMWKNRGRVPVDKCPAVERALDGKVVCEELCPDVDWGYLRGTAQQIAIGRRSGTDRRAP